MELNIRLSAKDVQAKGVFDALERLCLCFKPEDDKYERIQLKATAENTPNSSRTRKYRRELLKLQYRNRKLTARDVPALQ